MTRPADDVYAKTATDLYSYEMAAFSALRSFVPNYYRDSKDNTMWGHILRVVAKQMARLDYQTGYLVRGADPAMLTPADLLRQYGGPLHLNRNYPGKTQTDAAFKTMVLKLLEAYRLGATSTAIEKVIEAYTGKTYTVTELFKSIGEFYDQSDRNSIQVGIQLSQGSTAKTVSDVARAKDIVADLYTAIDLAKPAHVGLNLTTLLSEVPETIILNIQDSLRITMLLTENAPLEPSLYQAPFQDASTPDTGLSPAILNLSYQWYKDGVEVGTNSSTYTLTNVQIADNGAKVWAKITDPILGSVWTKQAVISVHDGAGNGASTIVPQQAPVSAATDSLKVTVQPFSRIVLVGASVAFEAAAANKVTPGVLSPRIQKVWEIRGESSHTLNLD